MYMYMYIYLFIYTYIVQTYVVQQWMPTALCPVMNAGLSPTTVRVHWPAAEICVTVHCIRPPKVPCHLLPMWMRREGCWSILLKVKMCFFSEIWGEKWEDNHAVPIGSNGSALSGICWNMLKPAKNQSYWFVRVTVTWLMTTSGYSYS